MGDGFYRSKDPTNSIEVLKEMLQDTTAKDLVRVDFYAIQLGKGSAQLWEGDGVLHVFYTVFPKNGHDIMANNFHKHRPISMPFDRIVLATFLVNLP